MKKELMPMAALLALPGALAHAQQKPNIIYILTDQHTAGALSCAGNEDLGTPNIDRIAANGVIFRNAYCTAPLSGPSRTSLFTGYVPSEVGMPRNKDHIQDSLTTRTLGNYVSSAGYECAYAGKWHVHEASIPDGKYGFRRIHGFDDEGLAESAVEFLKERHRKPFFLVASYDNPHNICEFAREQNLPHGNIKPVPYEEWVGLPANFARNPYDADVIQYEKSRNYFAYPTASYSADDWRKYRTYYFKLVEKVDAEIGKIIDEIDRQNLWKNTVVIFTSDHGDGVGAHGWNQKSALYEEVVNIPLVISLPGKKNAGQVRDHLVCNGLDLFSSICKWAGFDGLAPGQGGEALQPVLEDASAPGRDHLVVETMFDRGDNTRGWCVRTASYKYVIYEKGRHREQLFDMVRDRGEMRNLAVEGRFAPVLEEHRALLRQWLGEHHVAPTRKDVPLVPLPAGE